MATRFTRVDLGDDGRDFRPLALEPGVPLLDESGANAKILFRWLGRLAAEPVWEGESVSFFARDDRGGRLEEVTCEPATAEELEKLLQEDIATLRERIDKAQPETTTERALKKIIRRHFQEVFEGTDRSNTGSYVFRYRDANGNWRLVWCWGYQRIDRAPATAVVCAEDECNLLYVRRPGESPKCPACEALLVTRQKRKQRRRRRLAAAIVLLPLLLLALWWWYPSHLTATPEQYTGVVGSRVPVKVEKRWLFWSADVTDRVVSTASDPAVAEFDPPGRFVALVGPGSTNVRFRLGDLLADVAITAEPLGNGTGDTPNGSNVPGDTPLDPRRKPPKPKEGPVAVYILSDQGTSVQFGVGAVFDDFRIEAHYADGFVRMVTRKAIIHTTEPVLSPRDGRLHGLRPGTVLVRAEFDGVATKDPLECIVTEDIRVTHLGITPSPVNVEQRESLPITVTGYLDGKSVGILSGIAGITFRSANPSIAAVSGPHVTGVLEGDTKIMAEFAGVRSEPVDVHVGPISDVLALTPQEATIYIGQSLRVGSDVSVYRGDMDVSRLCSVVPGASEMIRYVPHNGSLVGVSRGTTQVTFLYRGKMVNMTLNVLGGSPPPGEVVVEPRDSILSPGQRIPLRVFVRTATGEKIDRTGAATLELVKPGAAECVQLQGNRVCALAPTLEPVEVAVSVPGSKPGKARISVRTVDDGPTELVCEPSPIVMAPGQRQWLTVLGRSSLGTYELFNVKLSVGGEDPDAVKLVGNGIEALRPGNATINVRWADLRAVAPVTVTGGPPRDLRIDPQVAAITRNESLPYTVTALRGGIRTVLTGADVQLTVSDPNVARVVGNELAVVGIAQGTTLVVARANNQTATASLTVGGTPPPLDLQIHPRNIVLRRVGETSPRITVTINGPHGREPISAVLRTLDPAVVIPEEPFRGRLVARGPGRTQILAEYGGKTATAHVTVEGRHPWPVVVLEDDPDNNAFRVRLDVVAPASSGPLEYRIYEASAAPSDHWVAGQLEGEYRRTVLRTESLPYRSGSVYRIVAEVRDKSGKVERYPVSFKVTRTIGIEMLDDSDSSTPSSVRF